MTHLQAWTGVSIESMRARGWERSLLGEIYPLDVVAIIIPYVVDVFRGTVVHIG
jgi:hypothetical protein